MVAVMMEPSIVVEFPAQRGCMVERWGELSLKLRAIGAWPYEETPILVMPIGVSDKCIEHEVPYEQFSSGLNCFIQR